MEKREQNNAKKNTNILTGSVQAVSSVGKGIFGGITGTKLIYKILTFQ